VVKNLERSSYGLFLGSALAFPWGDLGRPQEFSIRVASNQTDLPEYFRQKCTTLCYSNLLSGTSTSGYFVQM
jgi:hypothetical protein